MDFREKIAVIGGGLSGLVSVDKLKNEFDITLFEKSRGVGGRMSTRRAEPYQFDHGAQYFTARTKAFQSFLKPHIQSGLIQDWRGKMVTLEKGKKPYKRTWFEPHYIAAPRMNSLCKYLAQDIDTHFSIEISKITGEPGQWFLKDTAQTTYGPFNQVIVSAPSHQTALLLPREFAGLEKIKNVKMSGCYSVMLGLDEIPKLNWDIAEPKASLIGWIAVNSSKPNRETAPSLLIQTTNDWAEAHMDQNIEDLENIIIDEFRALSSNVLENIAFQKTHLWRYANTSQSGTEEYFWDSNLKIGVCGDWCIGGRVEAAFTSASNLSEKILKMRGGINV